MQDISSVIRNPEVSQMAPVLLAAMGDPANKTKEALEALLEVTVEYVVCLPSCVCTYILCSKTVSTLTFN